MRFVSQTLQGGDQFAGDRLVGRHPELLRQTHAHGGRELHYDLAVRVLDHVPHGLGLVFHRQSAGGANRRTLAAAHALGRGDIIVVARGNVCTLAAVAEIDGVDILHLVAHPHAKAAQDALGGVSHDALGAVINGHVGVILAKALHVHMIAAAVSLQLAAFAHFACGAVGPVAAQKKLKDHLTVSLDARGIGLNLRARPGL